MPAPASSREGPALSAEARKVVTILFADLVGSTGLTEQLDVEAAREVVGKFYRMVQDAVERFGGAVANLLGDAVLAVFGLPAAHEDDPERAVRAGLAIRDAMPALNEHLVGAHGVRLAVRVGINTGEVVAASGSTFDRDFLISDAVTTAARLQQTVAPGLVVVGERTHRLTEGTIRYRALPPLEVKGKATALAVWAADAPKPEPEDLRRVAAPLIGRHGEMGILRHLYARSRDESVVHLVTIFGQPGVGKSRLVREFLAEAGKSQPMPLVLRGRNVAFGEHIGFQALLDILRGHAGVQDTDAPAVVRSKVEKWLTSAVGTTPELLEGLLLTFGGETGPVDPGNRRRQLFDAWTTVLSRLAEHQPVVLALEDLHWADDGLLDLIEWLSDHLHTVRVFMVCLARPELLERRPTWGGGRRNASTIDLLPLRTEEAEQLVVALSSQGLGPELRQMITQRAEGNPLFVEEIVRMLLEGGGPAASIPDTVQAVLTARIDRLPRDERRALQAAAAVGRSFWASAVAVLAGLSPEATHRALDGLVAKELIARRSQSAIAGEPEYAFRHILTRDVAYGMLPRGQRQRAHLEAARWLESRLGERVEDAVEILAEHLRLAGEDAQAARYLARAASKARRLYANADAIRLYDQAEEAAVRAGLSPSDRAGISLGRGEVYELMGRYAEALAQFDRGLALAREAQHMALEASLENRLGLIHHREFRLREARTHFERAAALARNVGDDHLLGLSLIDLANVDWDMGALPEGDPRLTEAIALLRRTGHRSSLARGLNLLCMARYAAGDAPGAIAAAHEALDAARDAGDKSREATSLSYLSVVNTFWGRHHDALRDGEAAIALADQIGDRRRKAFALTFVAHSRIALGDWGAGMRLLEESLPLVREVARIHLPFLLAVLGSLYCFIGDEERARTLLEETRDLETYHASWRMILILARIYAARIAGDPALRRALVDELLSLPWGLFIADDGEITLPLGEELLEQGRVDDARRLVHERRADFERWGAPPHLAGLALLAARLAAHDGHRDRAVALVDDALRLGESVEDSLTILRARELRVRLTTDPSDRGAFERLIAAIATTLPADLAARFVETRRAAAAQPLIRSG
ncbi:MAG: tetratricopeptide repeat protein [Armatimonadota bacterium]|nr:tetratricopeptide repeat protein [Armatimonadota bacterium]